jgi:membrane-associated protein
MILAGVVSDLTGWIDEVSGKWWFLGVIFIVAYLDSVIPIVPSETTVIIGGVAAGQHHQFLPFVILAGAAGAFLGDHTAYFLGRAANEWFQRRAERKPKFGARLDKAREQIRKRGGSLLVTARFIPGGRTILTLASGVTQQPRVWFTKWIAIATIIWASYAALLGYIGGKAFKDNHTKAFVTAFVLALAATVFIEIVRHFVDRRRAARAVRDAL